jgi:hypothetical protein
MPVFSGPAQWDPNIPDEDEYMETIDEWYERRRREASAAWAALEAARARRAPAEEIKRLEREYDIAADMGD